MQRKLCTAVFSALVTRFDCIFAICNMRLRRFFVAERGRKCVSVVILDLGVRPSVSFALVFPGGERLFTRMRQNGHAVLLAAFEGAFEVLLLQSRGYGSICPDC